MQVIAHRFFDRPTMIPPSVRSLGAVILLLVFVFGQFALLPTVMMRVASMSNEHQLLIVDHKLVLHHVVSPKAAHLGLTQWLVAMSQTDDAGDHVLPLDEPDRCDELRALSVIEVAKDPVFEPWSYSSIGHLVPWSMIAHEAKTDQHRSAEMTIAQWSSIRLII
jgi:hypothetical protein